MNATKTNAEMLLDLVKSNPSLFNEEVISRIESDIEKYDRDIYNDWVDRKIITISSYGSIWTYTPEHYAYDPYRAKLTLNSNRNDIKVLFDPASDNIMSIVSHEEACDILYAGAKAAYKQYDVPEFNNIAGYIISFDELLGSVPEHMRKVIEDDGEWTDIGFVNHTKNALNEWYNREVSILISYMRLRKKRVKVTDKETGEEEWIDVPVSNIGIGFNKFDGGERQSLAYFCVTDNSPTFNPEPHYNYHGNEDSRVLYNGAICLSYSKVTEDDGTIKEVVQVSSHH